MAALWPLVTGKRRGLNEAREAALGRKVDQAAVEVNEVLGGIHLPPGAFIVSPPQKDVVKS